MSASACLIVHPYTARKDIGAGHDRYAYELLNRLPSLGVTPTLFESGHLTTVSQALMAEVKAVARLACMRGKERVYHATATVNAQSAITARKHPLVTTIHDVLWFAVGAHYDSRIKYFLKTNAIRRAAARSDALIVPFASTRDFLVNELKTPAERIHIVPYGVDHDQFYGMRPEEDLPRPVFFPAGKVVLFVGAVNFGKGIDTLIQCFDRVVKSVPDAQLVVGSGGWDTPLLRPIWEKSSVKEHIRFVGFIPEGQLRSAYVHADLTAFPSRYGFGLATLESMACGTPTVSGRTLDAPEFIGDAGLMADPNDAEELATQIIRGLVDGELRESLIRRGLGKSAAFRWQQMAVETAAVYRTLL